MSDRLDYLRDQIQDECISYSEIAELQQLGREGLIPEDDLQLRQWAEVPEDEESSTTEESPTAEERLFHAMHDGLTSYIQHRIPGDVDRADDVYQEVIDLVIAKTE